MPDTFEQLQQFESDNLADVLTCVQSIIDGYYTDSSHDELCRAIDILRVVFDWHEAGMGGAVVQYDIAAFKHDYNVD